MILQVVCINPNQESFTDVIDKFNPKLINAAKEEHQLYKINYGVIAKLTLEKNLENKNFAYNPNTTQGVKETKRKKKNYLEIGTDSKDTEGSGWIVDDFYTCCLNITK